MERAGDLRLLVGGLKLELLESEGVLAKALTDAKETSIAGGIFDAQSFDAITIKAGDDMIKLSNAEMEDGLVEPGWFGPFEQFQNALVPGAEVGSDLLMADPVLVTAVVPVGEIIDGQVVDAIRPAMAMLLQFIDDAGVLDTVIEHVVNEVPKVLREASDFTGSTIHSRGSKRNDRSVLIFVNV